MEKIFCEKIKKEIDRTECVKCKYYEDGSKHYSSKGCYYIIRTHRADIDTVIDMRKKRYDYFMEIAEKNYKINRPKIAQEFEIKAYYELDEFEHIKLLNALKKHKGKVMISSYENDLYDTHLKGWGKEQKSTTAEGSVKRIETIYMNY